MGSGGPPFLLHLKVQNNVQIKLILANGGKIGCVKKRQVSTRLRILLVLAPSFLIIYGNCILKETSR